MWGDGRYQESEGESQSWFQEEEPVVRWVAGGVSTRAAWPMGCS